MYECKKWQALPGMYPGHLQVDNPATGDVIAKVPNFKSTETNAAIKAASQAFPIIQIDKRHFIVTNLLVHEQLVGKLIR